MPSLRVLLIGVLLLPSSGLWAYSPPDTEPNALHVLNRLGYGPAPDSLDAIHQQGISAYIEQQLSPESIPMSGALMATLQSEPGYGLSVGELFRQYGPAARKRAQEAGNEDAYKEQEKAYHQGVAQARLLRASQSPRQLEEVMTEFWFNHFNVFAGKGLDHIWVQSFEDTAIRPHALGHFRELLGATAHHPAMLFYLDNWESAAPGAQLRNRNIHGLNENYARELLELHTLGVDGGYTQDDVIALARILTGWTINRHGMEQGDNEAFAFNPRMHDTGDKVLLGKHVAGTSGLQGEEEGEVALDLLARSPATAHHISYQLAQFFVADVPPRELVDQLTQVYLRTDGDIRSLLRTLFASKAFWAPEHYQNQTKTPYAFAVSALRASGGQLTDARPVSGFLQQAGQPLYGWQTPDGYKYVAEAWINPDALLRRVNFATALGSGRVPLLRSGIETKDSAPLDADALLRALGSSIGGDTRAVIAQSPAPVRASLVLGSPDFMKR